MKKLSLLFLHFLGVVLPPGIFWGGTALVACFAFKVPQPLFTQIPFWVAVITSGFTVGLYLITVLIHIKEIHTTGNWTVYWWERLLLGDEMYVTNNDACKFTATIARRFAWWPFYSSLFCVIVGALFYLLISGMAFYYLFFGLTFVTAATTEGIGGIWLILLIVMAVIAGLTYWFLFRGEYSILSEYEYGDTHYSPYKLIYWIVIPLPVLFTLCFNYYVFELAEPVSKAGETGLWILAGIIGFAIVMTVIMFLGGGIYKAVIKRRAEIDCLIEHGLRERRPPFRETRTARVSSIIFRFILVTIPLFILKMIWCLIVTIFTWDGWTTFELLVERKVCPTILNFRNVK